MSFFVSGPAGISLHKAAACPHHRGEKSLEAVISALARIGASASAARGKSGVKVLIGPKSRIRRLMMPRAGLPVNTFVIDHGLVIADTLKRTPI